MGVIIVVYSVSGHLTAIKTNTDELTLYAGAHALDLSEAFP